MHKMLRFGLVVGLMVFAFSPRAHAQNMGICAGWVPLSNCGSSNTLDIGLTGNTNPTFTIAVNGGGMAQSTDLVVLIPTSGATSSTLTFTATFQAYDSMGQASGSPVTVSASAFSGTPYTSGYLLNGYFGLTVANGQDYHFNSINGVEAVSGNPGFTAYLLQPNPAIPLSAGNGYVQVSFSTFSSGSGFPVGTIFLALGDNGTGSIIYNTPLTQGLEDTVPEPMSLVLFGTGLLGIALLVRRRAHKQPVVNISKSSFGS